MRPPHAKTFLLALGFLLVLVDQLIKVRVKTTFALGETVPVLGQWFRLVFVENNGMAFGFSAGGVVGKYALTLLRLGLSALLVVWIARLCARGERLGLLVGLTLIASGAVGNVLDCLFYGLVFGPSTPYAVAETGGHYAPFMQGHVVDMFYFPLWVWPDWLPLLGGHVFFEPVFNFADACVSVGAVYLLLFHFSFFRGAVEGDSQPGADGTTDPTSVKPSSNMP